MQIKLQVAVEENVYHEISKFAKKEGIYLFQAIGVIWEAYKKTVKS